MIEINLSPSKKGQSELQELINKINIKMMIVAILLYFVPEMLYLSMVDDELAVIQNRMVQVNNELKQLSTKVSELKKIEDQIDALKALEKKLAEKLEVVKKIISKRQNPFLFLQYVANNTPKDLWITDMKLDGNDLEFSGFSDSWKSIGVFLENLKSSIFFDKSIQYVQPKERDPKYKEWERKENFLITSKVVRFE